MKTSSTTCEANPSGFTVNIKLTNDDDRERPLQAQQKQNLKRS